MTQLQHSALARLPLTEAEVKQYYRIGRTACHVTTHGATIMDLCTSHERLRAELAGLQVLYDEVEAERVRLAAELAAVRAEKPT